MNDRRLRILHCIASVDPRQGGTIEAIRLLGATHLRQGHHVEIASLDSPQDPWVSQCQLPCQALGPGRLGGYRYSPRWAPWLSMHAHRFDAVIVHGIWQYHAFGTWLALRHQATPYFVFTHGMLDPWFKRTYPLKHLKKWLYWPWSEYRLLRDARAVLFTGQEERRLARESFWLSRWQARVVACGTTEPPPEADTQRTTFLQRFPHLAGRRVLLFLGRVHEKKGPDMLLQALARLRQTAPHSLTNVHLVMAGPADDAYGQAMQALARDLGLQDHVTWTGMLSGDAKWGAFRVADAFILPSHQENFGIAVAESLACGVPVLISRQVNIWREIDGERAGLVDDDTVDGTERLLTRWLATPADAWAATRVRAQACFQRHFHVEQAAEALIQTVHDSCVTNA